MDKDWTFEQALAAQAEAQAGGLDSSNPTGPLWRWNASHKLDALEKRFSNGDNFSLLHAIRVCANHDLVIPEWAAQAFIRRFDGVLNYRTDSWDVAFGRPHPKGMHVGDAHKRRTLRFQVHNRITEIRLADPNVPIDEQLFEEVGDQFDIGKTLCNKLYYEAERIIRKATLPALETLLPQKK